MTIEQRAELPDAYATTHRVIGLPFFNDGDWPAASRFREARASILAK